MYKYFRIIVPLTLIMFNCKENAQNTVTKSGPSETRSSGITFQSSNKKLVSAFDWAKDKALSYAHTGDDPVGAWYEAALPNREAFCMRDVSHQAIGAELLGLSEHNFNMFLKFAENISAEKDYCSYWEINRHNLPAPVDYENDKDFWYNLPANFDVIYNAYRLYEWTGNEAYLKNAELQNFYNLSMNEYVDHWDLGNAEVLTRNRALHEVKKDDKRFEGKRGIPTYNEGGRGETQLGIDMTASLIAAYRAVAQIEKLNGDLHQFEIYTDKAEKERGFLIDYWWDAEKNAFRSIIYADGEFDYFMVGDDQAFLHYLLYFDALADPGKIKGVVNAYAENFDKLIVELKSYLPIIFYENDQSSIANQMVIDLCAIENGRRDYPENSFTVIEHLARGLMGINVDAGSDTFSTVSRLEYPEDWAEMNNVPIRSNKVSIKHEGRTKSTATNLAGPKLKWEARVNGDYAFLYVDGVKTNSQQIKTNEKVTSYCEISIEQGDHVIVSATPLQ